MATGDLKDTVLQALHFPTFYAKHLKELSEPNDEGWAKARCPFHDDSHPSFGVNLQTGGWNCYAGCGKGDVFLFWAELKKIEIENFGRVLRSLASEVGVQDAKKTVDMALVMSWHHWLLRLPDKIDELATYGLSKDTINNYFLGFDGERFTIPVFDEDEDCVNVRRYDPKATGKDKMLSYDDGYGNARLYPYEAFQGNGIHIMEGEKDALNARQRGVNAVSVTGGAGTWRQAWNKLFRDKHVAICYDCDKAGRSGADKIAQQLYGMAASVRIVDLEIVDPPKGDFTDYVVNLGHAVEDYIAKVEATPEYAPFSTVGHADSPDNDKTVYKVGLAVASREIYYNKIVEIPVIVAGKDLQPYMVPRRVAVGCEDKGGKPCDSCPFRRGTAADTMLFESDDPRVLKMVACSNDQLKGMIKRELGIPPQCRNFSTETLETQNVTSVRLIPEPEFEVDDTAEYVARSAFVVGRELVANNSYVVIGKTVPDPKTQYATHLLYSARPAEDGISTFAVTPELTESLKIFEGDPAVMIPRIVRDLEANITRIYGREDLHIAVDLVYHSILGFVFQERLELRGYLDALIIGDTRSGKSEAATRLRGHYMAGEIVTAENSSYAGLVGGVSRVGDRWHLTWGKIPLSNGRLIVIDETSGMAVDDIGRMSGLRSSGIAEINKINHEKTRARTRLIWISNPRADQALRQYNAGIEAVMQLIGRPEDVARYDFAVTCASNEVPQEIINAFERPHVEHEYTTELCHSLVLWAWSRKPEHVVFTEEATRAILAYALEMGKKYSTKIPLVEGANQRIKLARLAAAVAARVHSTDESGERVIIKTEHVKFGHDFLVKAYRKPSMRYEQWSADQGADVFDEEIIETMQLLDEIQGSDRILRRANRFHGRELGEMLGLDQDTQKRFVATLARNGMISRSTSGYYKNEALIRLLNERRDGGDVVLSGSHSGGVNGLTDRF